MRISLVVFGGALLLGCSGVVTRSLDPVPGERAATLETTDDGKPVLQVKDGRLAGIEGRRLELAPGKTTFLVYFDPEMPPNRRARSRSVLRCGSVARGTGATRCRASSVPS